MIEIEKLNAGDVGRKVVYHSFNQREDGVISSWNDKYVFVRYGNNVNGTATSPEDLAWLFPNPGITKDEYHR